MACNIYITTESKQKLKQLFCNASDFYMLDVAKLVASLNIDLSKASSIYLINEEIEKLIMSRATLKRVRGIFYIISNMSEQLINNIKIRLSKLSCIDDFILIDNGFCPKHEKFTHLFNDVIFYERFRKNKIIQCAEIKQLEDNKDRLSILLEGSDEK